MTKKLICIGGLPGVGKTEVANRLSQNILNNLVICPDELRLEMLGKNPKQDVLTDADITDETTRKVIAVMLDRAELALQNDKVVIIGSAFVSQSMRQDYEAMAKKLSAPFHGVWLELDDMSRIQRTEKRKNDYLDTKTKGLKRGKNPSIVTCVNAALEVEGDIRWPIIDASPSAESVLQAVQEELRL